MLCVLNKFTAVENKRNQSMETWSSGKILSHRIKISFS